MFQLTITADLMEIINSVLLRTFCFWDFFYLYMMSCGCIRMSFLRKAYNELTELEKRTQLIRKIDQLLKTA